MMSITISGYNQSLGQVAFTGDGAGDVLTLSEQPSPDLPGNPTVLAYNLGGGDNSLDTDLGGGQELVIGQGSDPTITVDFSAGGVNTLQLDTTWDFTEPVQMIGAGSDTLASGVASSNTWTITGAGAGNIDSTVNFSGVGTLQASPSSTATIQGQDGVAATWSLSPGSETYTAGGGSMSFGGFADAQAGSGTNTFDISGSIDDGDVGPINLNGGSGANTFDFSDTAVLDGSIVGGTGSNTLAFYDAGSSSGYASGLDVSLDSVGPVGYGGFAPTLTGTFSNINGVIGNAAEGFGCELDGLDDPGTWTLAGTNSITYTDTASVSNPSMSLSGFTDLYGGAGNDAFDVTGNTTVNVNGGLGTNDLVFGDGAVLDGSVSGTDGTNFGTNTLDFSAYTTAITTTLDSGAAGMGVGGTTGGATNPITGRFDDIGTIIAGTPTSGTNALTGEDATRTWDLGVTDTYGDGTNAFLTFSGFGSLTAAGGANTFNVQAGTTADLHGGVGTNDFVFSDGAVLTGSIDGPGGTNTLDLTAYSTPVTTTLTSGAATGVGGTTNPITGTFADIGTLEANAAVSNALTGDDADSTWTLGATQTYGAAGTTYLTFSGFSSLTGGGGADTFDITASTTAYLNGGAGNNVFDLQTDGVTLNGAIDGGSTSGNNTLEYSGYTSSNPVVMNLATGLATGTRGVKHIQDLVGGNAATTQLVGFSSANQWYVTANDAGYITNTPTSNTVTFSNVGKLTGGIGADDFYLSDGATVIGGINGGLGANSIRLGQYSNAAVVDITGANAGTVQEDGTSGTLASFTNIGTADGTSLGDTFHFSNGAQLSGAINAGGGGALDYSAYTTGVRANLSLGTATGVAGGIMGISNVTGGSGNDILIGNSANDVLDGGSGGNDILVGRGGNDTLTVHGSGRNILIGGTGTSTLNAGTATGDNLLIAGKVVFSGSDMNIAALDSLMAEWSRPGVSFAVRCEHLTGQLSGGLNGPDDLIFSGANQDVFGSTDSAEDTLNGSASGPGNTWFVVLGTSGSTTDTINNKRTGDRVDYVPNAS